MPATSLRRALALVLLGFLAAAPSACRDQPQGAVKVLVIGEPPKLRDPYQGQLATADAVLLANVAQGLVRFDAGGNIVGAIAERWNVSDDGLSYIFRIASAEWPDGRKITAQQVARALKRQVSRRSRNPLNDTLGSVEDIVAMTDRVIEIQLRAPRPDLLALLAQPELGILRDGVGTGPFTVVEEKGNDGPLRLRHDVVSAEDEVTTREELLLGSASAEQAVRAFAKGDAHLVLGGTFADLPYARAVRLPRDSLRFDPVSGLFGLVPARAGGAFGEPELRRVLSQAIDRGALIAALDVPGLAAQATVLEPGLDGMQAVQPAWFSIPVADRRPALQEQVARQFGRDDKPLIRVALPKGAGADILLRRLAADWGALGFSVERAASDAASDFKLVDRIAPSGSPAWFLRNFRCAAVPVCVEDADVLLDSARDALAPAERYSLIVQAAAQIDEAQLFIPLTAPIRWSLVARRIQGFSGNRYARHTLTGLERSSGSGGPS